MEKVGKDMTRKKSDIIVPQGTTAGIYGNDPSVKGKNGAQREPRRLNP